MLVFALGVAFGWWLRQKATWRRARRYWRSDQGQRFLDRILYDQDDQR
jgi:hypothetical protein